MKRYSILQQEIHPKQVIKNTKPLTGGAGAHSSFTPLISALLSREPKIRQKIPDMHAYTQQHTIVHAHPNTHNYL